MIRSCYCLLAVSFLLAGCPAPDKYVLDDGERITYLSETSISRDDFEIEFSNTYSWRAHNKRIIYSGLGITNKTGQPLTFSSSDILITTPTDTLSVPAYHTVTIAPGARQFIDLSLVSSKNYTKSVFRKKKKKEIIKLRLKVFDQVDTTIRLVYQRVPAGFLW